MPSLVDFWPFLAILLLESSVRQRGCRDITVHGCSILVSWYPAGDLNSLFACSFKKTSQLGDSLPFFLSWMEVSSVQKVAHMASFSVLTVHTWALNIPYIVFSWRRTFFCQDSTCGMHWWMSFAVSARFPMKGLCGQCCMSFIPPISC